MKTIILMRHSLATSDNPAFSDRERPLTQHGRELAEVTADLLLEAVRPDRVLCSSAVRTIETAEIFVGRSEDTQPFSAIDALYLSPGRAYPQTAAQQLTDDDDSVLLIGHNPGIASLICDWSGESLPIPPATVAIFRANVDDWKALIRTPLVVPEFFGYITNGVRIR